MYVCGQIAMYVCMYVCMSVVTAVLKAVSLSGGHTVATELPTSMGIKQSSSLRLTMYVCGQIAQVVEHQTADPWIAGSSLTSGEKCKYC